MHSSDWDGPVAYFKPYLLRKICHHVSKTFLVNEVLIYFVFLGANILREGLRTTENLECKNVTSNTSWKFESKSFKYFRLLNFNLLSLLAIRVSQITNYLEHILTENLFIIRPILFMNYFAEFWEVDVTISDNVICQVDDFLFHGVQT